MTEKNLIDFLSNESERMEYLYLDNKTNFDTDICAWKDTASLPQSSNSIKSPASFRIRTVEIKNKLSRNKSCRSSMNSLSSSSGSRNTSPGENPKGSYSRLTKDNKKRFPSAFYQVFDDTPIPVAVPSVDLRIRPPKPKKRKPVKAFKILKGNEE